MKAPTKKTRIIKKPNQKLSVRASSDKVPSHETDFYKWTKMQASYLKKGELEKLDIANLVEEIESLGRSERRALKSYLIILLLHLLKIRYQPKKRTRSWDLSILNSRHEIQLILKENPSLKREFSKILEDAYFSARLRAIDETGLEENIFPDLCLWKKDEVLIV